MQAARTQFAHLQVTLHGEHLSHAVGNGRASGKDDASAAVHRLHVANLEKQIESTFGSGLRQACHARHLGYVEQVFEILRFIHE